MKKFHQVFKIVVNENVRDFIALSVGKKPKDITEADIQSVIEKKLSVDLVSNIISFPFVDGSKEENGINWALNTEKRNVVATGTASSNATYIFIQDKVLQPGTYALRNCPRQSGVMIRAFNTSGDVLAKIDCNENQNTFTLESATSVMVSARIDQLTHVENVELSPELFNV